jgi:tripartite-type tricarboxylate transporter receptor subunit TctC
MLCSGSQNIRWNFCRAGDRANNELRAALASDEVRARIIAEGGEPEPTTPEPHVVVIDREDSKWSAVIRAAGIQAR